MTDFITNIDTTYTDVLGNTLIGSNDVVSVFYYDATTSGTAEAWTKNWTSINLFLNPVFQTVISGGDDWIYNTDDSGIPYKYPLYRYAGWNNTNYLEGTSAVTSSGFTFPYDTENLTNFRDRHGYRTSDNSQYANGIAFDLGSSVSINALWFLNGFSDDVSQYVKNYRWGLSDAGTGENEFTIVASGITTSSGLLSAEINTFPSQNARYVKFYPDTNWGGGAKIALGKIGAFKNPDWSAWGFREVDVVDGTFAELKQSVDMTNMDTIFYDVRAFQSDAFQTGQIDILVDDASQATYTWASTNTWDDSADSNYWIRREDSIDVSGFSSTHDFQLKYTSGSDLRAFDVFFDNIATQPGWFTEGSSSTRGLPPSFPDEVYIISDRSGLSIINKSNLSLWMRFNIFPGYFLEAVVRDIYANEGKLYLATSRGLLIVDFAANIVWRYNTSGLYYRKAIKRRNEVGLWFLEDAGLALASDDVYSVSVDSEPSLGTYIVVGTSEGLSYVKEEVKVNNSAFSYPVRKIVSTGDKVYYIGGFDSRSRLGVITTVTDLDTDAFAEQTILFTNENVFSDTTFSGSPIISPQWRRKDGPVPFSFKEEVLTLSGTKSDVGVSYLIQDISTPVRPFTASVDVKITDWVDKMQGGFHFGLAPSWPPESILESDVDNALFLSAVNGTDGVYIENETFEKGISSQWVKEDFGTISRLEFANPYVRVRGRRINAASNNFRGPVLGQYNVYPNAPDFIAKIKTKITKLNQPTVTGRDVAVVFGVSDGAFLGEGAGTEGGGIVCVHNNTDPSPAVYAMGTKTSNYAWTFDTTVSGVLFANDGTSSADFHTLQFNYDSAGKTVEGYVDSVPVGSVALPAGISQDIGIIFGVVSDDQAAAENFDVTFKEFEIDFGELPVGEKKAYVLEKRVASDWVRPTTGGNLNGQAFGSLDATPDAVFKTWQITYDGTTLSGSVAGQATSPEITTNLGDQPKIVLAYDMPASVSGTTGVEIQVYNFSINYTDADTVINGIPNSIFPVSGTTLGSEYITLWVATSSGVDQLVYADAVVGGTPDVFNTYGISNSSMQNKVLVGDVKNCNAVEADADALLSNGLAYVGGSRYAQRGWERIKDRAGGTGTTHFFSLGTTYSGTKAFLGYDQTGSSNQALYEKDLDSNRWALIAKSDVADVKNTVGRVHLLDVGSNGKMYFLAQDTFFVYDTLTQTWGTTNYGTGLISQPTSQFRGSNAVVALPRNELWLGHNSVIVRFFVESLAWEGGSFDFNAMPGLATERDAIVYSEVDDTIYLIKEDTSGNLFRLKCGHRNWSSALASLPVTVDYDHGIFAFYRPYDELIYVILKGLTDSVGRKIYTFNPKTSVWLPLGEDIPSAVSSFMAGSYSILSDQLFVLTGQTDAKMYRFSFPRDEAPRFVSWAASDGSAPDASSLARYRKISMDSGEYVGSDAFTDDSTDTFWFDFISHSSANTNVSESSSLLNFLLDHNAYSGTKLATRTQSVAMPPGDFVATMQVRITDMPVPSHASTINSFILGVTDHLGGTGYDTTVEVPNSLGQNGLWMVAYNDNSLSNRYSLWRREHQADSRDGATTFQAFNATDASSSAGFREWRVEYAHTSKQLSAYIDDTLIGSKALVGRGFEHGLQLSMGIYGFQTNSSGTVGVEVKDLVVAGTTSVTTTSDRINIYDTSEPGYLYYEKYDSTLDYRQGYAYESQIGISTHGTNSNSYVYTLGSVEDGNKRMLLSALDNVGTRQLGIYTGGDPRLLGSYSSKTNFDWSSVNTYIVVASGVDTVSVYTNGGATPTLTIPYDSMVDTKIRKVGFGIRNPEGFGDVISATSNNADELVVSGTWSSVTDRSAYRGEHLSNGPGTGTESISFIFNKTGDSAVYIHYSSITNQATDVPYTIRHEGVVELPVADSYATNPITAVSDNVDESGLADANSTTVDISQKRLADGRQFSALDSRPQFASGFVYLGTYTNVSKVVVTDDITSATVYADSVLLRQSVDPPRSTSTSRVNYVNYASGDQVYSNSDFISGFTVINVLDKTQLDAYSSITSPNILDDNVADLDVAQ